MRAEDAAAVETPGEAQRRERLVDLAVATAWTALDGHGEAPTLALMAAVKIVGTAVEAIATRQSVEAALRMLLGFHGDVTENVVTILRHLSDGGAAT